MIDCRGLYLQTEPREPPISASILIVSTFCETATLHRCPWHLHFHQAQTHLQSIINLELRRRASVSPIREVALPFAIVLPSVDRSRTKCLPCCSPNASEPIGFVTLPLVSPATLPAPGSPLAPPRLPSLFVTPAHHVIQSLRYCSFIVPSSFFVRIEYHARAPTSCCSIHIPYLPTTLTR